MLVKSVLPFVSVFFLALINRKSFADNESDRQTELKPGKIANEKPTLEVFPVIRKSPDSAIVVNKTSSSCGNQTAVISCLRNRTGIGNSVEIVNVTRLSLVLQHESNVTHRKVPGTCVVVLFYSPTCPFSCMAAPHFNALQRYFPDVKMVAVDAKQYRGFNSQYGIVGTPTLILFHSGRPAVRFNETSDYSLESFANFITKYTDINPNVTPTVTLADYAGPVSSVQVQETDYYLILSCLVIAARVLYSLYYTTWGRSFVDATLNAWREAEAQHHHAD